MALSTRMKRVKEELTDVGIHLQSVREEKVRVYDRRIRIMGCTTELRMTEQQKMVAWTEESSFLDRCETLKIHPFLREVNSEYQLCVIGWDTLTLLLDFVVFSRKFLGEEAGFILEMKEYVKVGGLLEKIKKQVEVVIFNSKDAGFYLEGGYEALSKLNKFVILAKVALNKLKNVYERAGMEPPTSLYGARRENTPIAAYTQVLAVLRF